MEHLVFNLFDHIRTCLFVDPTELEEKMVEGKIIVGANSHREICALHCSGNILIKKPQVVS